MMKKITGLMIFLMLFVLLLLTGCTATTSSVPLPTVEPTPSVDPNALVVFQEGRKYGVKKDNNIIMDAIWDDIHIYQIGDEEYINGVLGTSYEHYREGLFKADGSVIFDVSDDLIFYNENYGHYITHGKQLIDTNTWEVVGNGFNLERVIDEYAITKESYVDLSVREIKYYYNIYDIKAKKYLFKFKFKSGKIDPNDWLTYHVPEYYEGKGFLIKVTDSPSGSYLTEDTVYVTLTGKVFNKAEYGSIDLYPEDNIMVLDHEVYRDKDAMFPDTVWGDVFLMDSGEQCGFRQHICPGWATSSAHWSPITCDDGKKIMVGKQNTDEKEGLVIYDIDQHIITPIPDAVEVYSFNDDMAIVENQDGKYGYINTSGTLVYPYQFSDVENFSEGTAHAVLNYKKVTLDKEGNIQQ